MRPRWSRPRRIGSGAALALGALLILNVAGVLPYPGGPMREFTADGPLWLDTKPADQQGGFEIVMPQAAGLTIHEVFVTTVFLQNAGPWEATLERVDLVDGTPGLTIRSAGLRLPGLATAVPASDRGSPEAIDARYPDQHLGALPLAVAGNSSDIHDQLLLELQVTRPGEYSYRGVRVRYRVGPFALQAVYGQGAWLCFGPLPPNTTCAEPGFEEADQALPTPRGTR